MFLRLKFGARFTIRRNLLFSGFGAHFSGEETVKDENRAQGDSQCSAG